MELFIHGIFNFATFRFLLLLPISIQACYCEWCDVMSRSSAVTSRRVTRRHCDWVSPVVFSSNVLSSDAAVLFRGQRSPELVPATTLTNQDRSRRRPCWAQWRHPFRENPQHVQWTVPCFLPGFLQDPHLRQAPFPAKAQTGEDGGNGCFGGFRDRAHAKSFAGESENKMSLSWRDGTASKRARGSDCRRAHGQSLGLEDLRAGELEGSVPSWKAREGAFILLGNGIFHHLQNPRFPILWLHSRYCHRGI